MSEIFLVDLRSVFDRHYHASGSEEPADAASRGVVARIRGYAQSYQHVAICLEGEKNWRYETSSTYKANREAKPPEFLAQLERTIRNLEADGFPCWKAEGYEADDVIASAAKWARANDHQVVILTGDKDLCQLVDAEVQILSVSSETLMGPADVVAKFGVGPEQLGDWLALVGDKADNVDGVRGVGPKTATGLLAKYGFISRILEAADDPEQELTPKLREALQASKASLGVARTLVSLRSDVKLDFAKVLERREAKGLPQTDNSNDWDDKGTNMADEETEKTPESGEQPATTPAPPAATATTTAIVESTATEDFEAKAPEAKPVTTLARPVEWNHSLEPVSLRDAVNVARHLHNSRLFTHLPNPEAIFAGILLARSHGVETMKILAPGMLHNIKGKLSMSAQLIVGLVLRSGKAEYFDLVESTTKKATYVTKRKGSSRVVTFDYTIEEAEAAGLLKPTSSGEPSQFIKRPKTMLRHRCETELARAVYPDVVGGLYSPEELESAA